MFVLFKEAHFYAELLPVTPRCASRGSGETPQYFAVLEDEDDEMKEDKDLGHLTGFIDSQAESEFFHYLSIGRLPTTAAREQRGKPGRYKTDEGGGIALSHASGKVHD